MPAIMDALHTVVTASESFDPRVADASELRLWQQCEQRVEALLERLIAEGEGLDQARAVLRAAQGKAKKL